jgi:hypothetical protein
MKRIFLPLGILAFFAVHNVVGQSLMESSVDKQRSFSEKSFNPTQKVKTRGDEESTTYDAHWAGFDIGFNTLMSGPFEQSFTNHPYWKNNIAHSIQFNFNLLEYKLPFFKQFLGLTTGLGVSVSNYSFKNDAVNYTLQFNPDSTYASVFNTSAFNNDTVDGLLKRNELTLGYIQIPLLFEFASKNRQEKSFYLSAGVVGGLRFSSVYSQKGKYESGAKFINSTRAKYNTNLLSFEATARFGYSWFGGFLSYNLNTLFKSDKTIAIYPFRAGITLNIDEFSDSKEYEEEGWYDE